MMSGEMPDWAVDAAVESAQEARAERRRAETELSNNRVAKAAKESEAK